MTFNGLMTHFLCYMLIAALFAGGGLMFVFTGELKLSWGLFFGCACFTVLGLHSLVKAIVFGREADLQSSYSFDPVKSASDPA